MRVVDGLLGIALVLGLSGAALRAQTTSAGDKADAKGTDKAEAKQVEHSRPADTRPVETFYLHGNQTNEGNEILTALRLMLDPSIKMYLDQEQNAILVRANPDDIALARKLIDALDLPKKTYRLTYTVNEKDAGKLIGTQHFAIIAAEGQKASLKDGSKVPIATGSYDEGKNGSQTQYTYLDVGLNFKATLTNGAGGVILYSQVEESSVTDQKAIAGVDEPLIRQVVLEGTTLLTLNKSVSLGSLDVPGSTRHMDIEALVEEVH